MGKQILTNLKEETGARKPVAYIFFFFLPFILLLILFLIIRKNPLDFRLVFSDELDYWAETASLIERGLFSPNAGYFGYSYSNHARFLYFGAHGFFNLIPYALFGFFAPRTHLIVLLLNALFMGISLSTSYYLLGSFRKILAIALLLFGFYPFYLYYQTGMMETLYYAGSIFLAILCVKCFAKSPRQWYFLKLYFWLVIIFSLFRLSNFVLIIPAFFLEINLKKQKFFVTLIKYGAAAVLVALLSILPAATYPWGFLSELGKAANVPTLILGHTAANIKLFFDLKAGYALEILPRFLFLFWLVFLCIHLLVEKNRNNRGFNNFLVSQILSLLALLLLNLILYDIGSFRDLRVFSPILVFSMIAFFLSSQGKHAGKWVLGLAVIFLLASNYVVFKDRNLAWDLFIADRYEATQAPAILKDVRYNPDAKTRWENTVYVDLDAYGELDWQNYDPGIGLMVLSPEEADSLESVDLGQFPKARYIVTQESIQISDYKLTKSEPNAFLYVRK